jgi:uncharacterized protein (TIGR02588 family)
MNKSESGLKRSLKLAEWLTLVVSSILVLAVVVFLVVELLQKEDEFAVIEIKPNLAKTQERGGHFILPVEVLNHGNQTLSEVAIRAVAPGGSETAPHDFVLDYLGAKATEQVFMIFDLDPRKEKLVFKPLHYQID